MTRFKVRERLRKLLGLSKEDTTKESDLLLLDEAARLIKRDLIEVAGSERDYEVITDWIRSNPDRQSVQDYKKIEGTPSALSFIRIKTAFAKVVIDFDQLNGNPPRGFADQELTGIIENGRWIRAIAQEGEALDESARLSFAYTIGNSLNSDGTCELLSFFPGQRTIHTVLNAVSRELTKSPLKDIKPNDYVEFEGFLGAFGEIPIRMRLLSSKELERSFEVWTTGAPRDSRVCLVEIPDLEGRFASDEDCHPDVRIVFPSELAVREKPTKIEVIKPETDLFPISVDAFHICLGATVELLKCKPSDSNSWQPQSWGTLLTLINAQEAVNPELYALADQDDEEEHLRFCRTMAETLTSREEAKKWVLECLEDYSDEDRDEDIAFDWCLEPPKDLSEDFENLQFHTHFRTKEELLESIDWGVVAKATKMAYQDSLNNERVEHCRIHLEIVQQKGD